MACSDPCPRSPSTEWGGGSQSRERGPPSQAPGSMASSARPASAGGKHPQLGSNQVQSDRRSCTRSDGQCTVTSDSRLVIPIGGWTAGTTGPRGQDDADGTQGLSCSPWHGVRAWTARWSSQGLHFTSSMVVGLVCPSVPVSHHLLLLPAAGVPAELVDKPPAVHPLENLPLVVVPHGPAQLLVGHAAVLLLLAPQLGHSL